MKDQRHVIYFIRKDVPAPKCTGDGLTGLNTSNNESMHLSKSLLTRLLAVRLLIFTRPAQGRVELKEQARSMASQGGLHSMQYLLTLPLVVLAFKDNHQAAVTVPAATCIEVVGPVEDDDRFLLISVGHGQFHIFASDLADRAIPVPAREQAPSFQPLA